MGLDAVEIVMAVEERFGIAITDAEATACTTPGLLVDLVMEKLPQGDAGSCASRRAFHLLRSALAETTETPRETIRPDSALPLPRDLDDATEFWERLRESVGAKTWPDLVRPRWMTCAIWTVALLAGFATALADPSWLAGPPWLAILAAGLVAWLLSRSTRRFRRRIPRSFATVRSLVPFAETAASVRWSRAEVAQAVREIVIEVIGLKEKHYSEDADFIKDLGLD